MRSYDISELVDFTTLSNGQVVIEPQRGPSPPAAWEDAYVRLLQSENERLRAENDQFRRMLGLPVTR